MARVQMACSWCGAPEDRINGYCSTACQEIGDFAMAVLREADTMWGPRRSHLARIVEEHRPARKEPASHE